MTEERAAGLWQGLAFQMHRGVGGSDSRILGGGGA